MVVEAAARTMSRAVPFHAPVRPNLPGSRSSCGTPPARCTRSSRATRLNSTASSPLSTTAPLPALHFLYSDFGMCNVFHEDIVPYALGPNCRIIPTWAYEEDDIRTAWEPNRFDSAFVVLNNIGVPGLEFNPLERHPRVLELVSWMRSRSQATILAICVTDFPGIEHSALYHGADHDSAPLNIPATPPR